MIIYMITTISKTCTDLEAYKLLIRQFQINFSFLHHYLLDAECFNLGAKTCQDNQRTVQDGLR